MTMFGFPKNNISNCIYIDFNFLIWIIFYSYLVPPMTTTMTTTCSFIFIENFSLQSLRMALRRKEGRKVAKIAIAVLCIKRRTDGRQIKYLNN